MLQKLIDWALLQRLLVLLGALLLAAMGLRSAGQLPIDAFPDVSPVQVKLVLKAPGMTPEEVESRIVVPLEQELTGIPGQRSMRSTSKYAIADLTMDFEPGVDLYWARQQVGERLSAVRESLPSGTSGGLAPVTTPLGEMFMFTVEGPQSLQERRTVMDTIIRPALRSVPGVADVNALGGHARAFEVIPDPVRLAARHVSLEELREALARNNRNDGAGRLTAGEEALLVRSEGAIQSLEDLRRTPIRHEDGYVLQVQDVATVQMGSLTRYGAVTRSGQGETVEGLVLSLRGADASAVLETVKAKLAELAPRLPPGMKTEPFYDRGALVGQAVRTVGKALLEAVVLVVLLLLVFLGHLRPAIVVASVLPLSALATFWLMQQTHLGANLMSLGGLAIAIGMLVDTAVVVVENIESRMARHPARSDEQWIRLIRIGAQEVAKPVAAGVVIIMLVFLPLLTLEGLEGQLFRPVALTILYAMGASLLLALTVVPVLASVLLKAGQHGEPRVVRLLTARYRQLLGHALARPKAWVIGTLLATAGAVGALAWIGKSFMPVMDEGDIIVSVEHGAAIQLDESIRLNTRLQRALMEVPEVKGIVARTGSDELGLDPMGLNQTDTFLVLKPRSEWQVANKAALLDSLRAKLADFPGVQTSFTQPIEMRVNEMILGVRGDIAIKIYGQDLEELNHAGQAIHDLLTKMQGAEDVQMIRNEGFRYLQVRFDRSALGRLGLTIEQVQDDLRLLVESQTAGSVQVLGRAVPIILRGPSSLRMSPDQFAALRLPLKAGQSIALSDIASLEESEGPVKIDRDGGMRYVAVTANVRGRDLVGFVEEAQSATASLKLPRHLTVSWGGQYENQQRAARRLALVVPAALGMILLLLHTTFGSLRQALLVFLNVPLALIGGVVALGLSGEYLSVPASVGFIALMGIAVLNGLVLVNHFNERLEQGEDLQSAVFEGAIRRLRPVLMTASITAFGLLPMLFASGPGAEVQRPLAIVVIGGLVSSTALTLILLPILFIRFGLRADPSLNARTHDAEISS